MVFRQLILVFALSLAVGHVAVAAEPTAEQLKFFETSIRPVLAQQCFGCHGEKKQWSGLRLDSREALLKGGDFGPSLVPGKPDESLLLTAIRQSEEFLKMPPKGKLTDRQIANFTRWVEWGAPFPEAATATKKFRDPAHWAFQPPVRPDLPKVDDPRWVENEIDLFVRARQQAAGITPAPAADRLTFLRRVTFDLTGLPPTPEEVREFLADASPAAQERLVDRLLASPAYGERWARHWLDIARYADSNGLDENVAFGNAWRYRDYVVAAFNDDKPYDRFLREQLAGDLEAADAVTESERHERLIATGFLALGAKVLAEVDESKMEMDIVDEQMDAFGRALLGLTLGCCRCHDHKFDPIDITDYYGLAGVFKSTHTMDSFTKVAKWHEHPIPRPEDLAAKAAFEKELARRKAELADFVAQADVAAKSSLKPDMPAPEKLESLYPAETKAELKKRRDEVAKFEKTAPVMPSALGVSDGKANDVAVHLRGSHLKLGDIVGRRVPRLLEGSSPPSFSSGESGRRELAEWLTSPGHPLTSRVIVNRVWRWHFGHGLVRTTDNFGQLGEAPTHRELLDWLALRFIEDGWSFKTLHRRILLSATYRQGSVPSPGALEKDPENRLLSRADVRRLEAEAIRDAMLATSGQLDRTFGGSLLKVPNRGYLFDHTSKDLTTYDSERRSLYLPVIRNNPYDVFQLLDFPDATIPNGDRSTTTVAPQALLMLNSDLVARCSDGLSARLLGENLADDSQRLQRLYSLAYAREIAPAEMTAGRALLAEFEEAFQAVESDAAQRRRRVWAAMSQVLLASNEFIYVN